MEISLISINPLDVLLWTLRRNEKDVVNLYSTLSPVMQLATGGSMLNFGYWDNGHSDPVSAQENLCRHFAELAELKDARNIVDVGSGLSSPADFWRDSYAHLAINCVDINYPQLRSSGSQKNTGFVNASSVRLPFSENSVDRVLALESGQHFKPFSDFVSESKRILTDSGLLAIAIPVVVNTSSIGKLGILKFAWSSEHYSIRKVRDFVTLGGFSISKEEFIGPSVYEPLADYYLENRGRLRKLILQQYSSYVETILFKSIQKMKEASREKTIEYLLLKCRLPPRRQDS